MDPVNLTHEPARSRFLRIIQTGFAAIVAVVLTLSSGGCRKAESPSLDESRVEIAGNVFRNFRSELWAPTDVRHFRTILPGADTVAASLLFHPYIQIRSYSIGNSYALFSGKRAAISESTCYIRVSYRGKRYRHYGTAPDAAHVVEERLADKTVPVFLFDSLQLRAEEDSTDQITVSGRLLCGNDHDFSPGFLRVNGREIPMPEDGHHPPARLWELRCNLGEPTPKLTCYFSELPEAGKSFRPGEHLLAPDSYTMTTFGFRVGYSSSNLKPDDSASVLHWKSAGKYLVLEVDALRLRGNDNSTTDLRNARFVIDADRLAYLVDAVD